MRRRKRASTHPYTWSSPSWRKKIRSSLSRKCFPMLSNVSSKGHQSISAWRNSSICFLRHLSSFNSAWSILQLLSQNLRVWWAGCGKNSYYFGLVGEEATMLTWTMPSLVNSLLNSRFQGLFNLVMRMLSPSCTVIALESMESVQVWECAFSLLGLSEPQKTFSIVSEQFLTADRSTNWQKAPISRI